MLSMFPALMPKNRRGRPNCRQASALRQSGWLRIATRNPAASRTRPRIAIAHAGWAAPAAPGPPAPPAWRAGARPPDPGRLQDPPEDPHRERRVVDVGISRDEDDVDRV